MTNDKDVRGIGKRVSRFCMTAVLLSVMVFVLVMGVMLQFAATRADGVQIIRGEESAAVNWSPLMMWEPESSDKSPGPQMHWVVRK
ncbi:MAG: hypothetical protein FWE55_00135 [Synergistaceae bacterium]|nr:hypothetical protein [Synergistaceae bacterium]